MEKGGCIPGCLPSGFLFVRKTPSHSDHDHDVGDKTRTSWKRKSQQEDDHRAKQLAMPPDDRLGSLDPSWKTSSGSGGKKEKTVVFHKEEDASSRQLDQLLMKRKSQYGTKLLVASHFNNSTHELVGSSPGGNEGKLLGGSRRLIRHPISKVEVVRQPLFVGPQQDEEDSSHHGSGSGKPPTREKAMTKKSSSGGSSGGISGGVRGIFAFLRTFDPNIYSPVGFFDCLDVLSEGDIVLFHTKKFASKLQRAVCASGGFDHIGLVVVYEECDDVRCCPPELKRARKGAGVKAWHTLEADSSGVSLYPFTPKSLGAYKGFACVRHLELDDEQFPPHKKHQMRNILKDFVNTMNGRPYEQSMLQIFRSAGFFGRNEEEDLSSVFCSELVAAAYIRLGLVCKEETISRPSNSYIPGDFASKNENTSRAVKLAKGVSLTREQLLDCTNFRLNTNPVPGVGANVSAGSALSSSASSRGRAKLGITEDEMSVSTIQDALSMLSSSASADMSASSSADTSSSSSLSSGKRHLTKLQGSGTNLSLLAKSKDRREHLAGAVDQGEGSSRLLKASTAPPAPPALPPRPGGLALMGSSEKSSTMYHDTDQDTVALGERLRNRRSRPMSLSNAPRKEVNKFARIMVRESLDMRSTTRPSHGIRTSVPLSLAELNSGVMDEIQDKKLKKYAYSAITGDNNASGTIISALDETMTLAKQNDPVMVVAEGGDDENETNITNKDQYKNKEEGEEEGEEEGKMITTESDDSSGVRKHQLTCGSNSFGPGDHHLYNGASIISEVARILPNQRQIQFVFVEQQSNLNYNFSITCDCMEAGDVVDILSFALVGPIPDQHIEKIHHAGEDNMEDEEALHSELVSTCTKVVAKECKEEDIIFDSVKLDETGWYLLQWENKLVPIIYKDDSEDQVAYGTVRNAVDLSFLIRLDVDKN